MPQSNSKSLDNLPYQFKISYTNSVEQIKQFGDSILMVDFSILANSIYFYEGVNQNAIEFAENAENWLYKIFGNNKNFVDENLSQLEIRKDEYVQNLYAQGIVFLWARLESYIKKLLRDMIEYDINILDNEYSESVSKIITRYKRTNSEEGFRIFFSALIRNKDCQNKLGAERYDCILKNFNLDGNLENKPKLKISELHCIRNCIVHNNFKVDKQLIDGCNWLNYKIGDKITIQQNDFLDYEYSVLIYITEIFYRLNLEFGAPKDYLKELRTKIGNFSITQ